MSIQTERIAAAPLKPTTMMPLPSPATPSSSCPAAPGMLMPNSEPGCGRGDGAACQALRATGVCGKRRAGVPATGRALSALETAAAALLRRACRSGDVMRGDSGVPSSSGGAAPRRGVECCASSDSRRVSDRGSGGSGPCGASRGEDGCGGDSGTRPASASLPASSRPGPASSGASSPSAPPPRPLMAAGRRAARRPPRRPAGPPDQKRVDTASRVGPPGLRTAGRPVVPATRCLLFDAVLS